MANYRTDYYYMTADERRAYHRKKQREYRERKAAIIGRTIYPRNSGLHPAMMTHDERLAYNRDQQRRYKERHKILYNEGERRQETL